MNKTKIVCTIGPKSCDKEKLKSLVKAGMNIVRLNGSHNVVEWHAKVIHLVRSVDKNIPILLDLPGRKIRTQKHLKPYKLTKNQEIIITSDMNYKKPDKVPTNYNGLHRDLHKGDLILADDGTLKFKVKKIVGFDIYCLILTDGELKGGKGLNVPYVKVNTPLVTETDKKLIKFAIQHKVDWVGVSFVESGEHVCKIEKLLGNSGIGVISKIENKFGLEKIEEIIEKSSGIMVDRGDLGAETSIENIGILQKEIIKKSNIYGKPVIIATEMLHSMIEKTQPTKAEIMDITNSVLDGASAIMLSGETAVGVDPVQAVNVMRSVADEVEKEYHNYTTSDFSITHKSVPNAIGKSIFEVCQQIPINKVICITLSGYAARMISRYRLNQPILAVTDTPARARQFNLMWGVDGVPLSIKFSKQKIDHILSSIKQLWQMKKIYENELVIITAVIFPHKYSKMNYMQIHRVGDMVKLFKWSK